MLFPVPHFSVCFAPMSVLSLGLIETRGLVAAIEAADAAAKAANVTLLSAELLGGGIVTLRLQGDLGAVQAAVEAGAQAAKRIGEVVAVRVIPRPVGELSALSVGNRSLTTSRKHTAVLDPHSHDTREMPTAPPAPAANPAPRPTPPKPKPQVASNSPKPKPASAPRVEPPPQAPAPATVHHTPATVSSRPRFDFAELEAMSVVRLRQFARSVKNLGIQGRQISMANKTQLLDAIRQATQP